MSADRTKAKSLGLSEGDGVFILGFPNLGPITEEAGRQNFVIVRRGTIARISDCLAGFRDTFLVDGFVFPGNSGGPVVNVPEAMAIQGTQTTDRAYLLGMVSDYVPYDEVAISQQTQRPRIMFEENSGIAEVIPVDVTESLIEPLLPQPIPQAPASPSPESHTNPAPTGNDGSR